MNRSELSCQRPFTQSPNSHLISKQTGPSLYSSLQFCDNHYNLTKLLAWLKTMSSSFFVCFNYRGRVTMSKLPLKSTLILNWSDVKPTQCWIQALRDVVFSRKPYVKLLWERATRNYIIDAVFVKSVKCVNYSTLFGLIYC